MSPSVHLDLDEKLDQHRNVAEDVDAEPEVHLEVDAILNQHLQYDL